ncbi:MAG: hypothetical protein LBK99_12745 [Opitutaceae bacterium]|jgi:hypothetical protein|nr:hypothetical protein [Opitutaceae bacterium]
MKKQDNVNLMLPNLASLVLIGAGIAVVALAIRYNDTLKALKQRADEIEKRAVTAASPPLP